MLEDKRLGAVLLRGPSRSDKAAGRSRTAGRQLTASQQGQLATLITLDCGMQTQAELMSRANVQMGKRKDPHIQAAEGTFLCLCARVRFRACSQVACFCVPNQGDASLGTAVLFQGIASLAAASAEPGTAPLSLAARGRRLRATKLMKTMMRTPSLAQSRPNSLPTCPDSVSSVIYVIYVTFTALYIGEVQTGNHAAAFAAAMPGDMQPAASKATKSSLHFLVAGAASQGSLRGLSLLAGLAENLQQTVEPLPDMDVNDAPVQDEDCAQLQCEDGKAGAAAGDDDAHHTDMPASPPSNAHPPELSVVPGPPLDNEPRDSEKSWQGQSTRSCCGS